MSDYYTFDKVQYKETQALVQNLYHYLITLAASLKGNLSSEEEDTLAHLFQVHMDLQMLLDEMSLRTPTIPVPAFDQDETQNNNGGWNLPRSNLSGPKNWPRWVILPPVWPMN